MTPCIVFVTASSQDEARKLARALLEAKLAACANIIPAVESHYWWKGKLETSAEYLLLIKSSREQFSAVSDLVRKLHSYECPEVVAISPDAVESTYLKWWMDEISSR